MLYRITWVHRDPTPEEEREQWAEYLYEETPEAATAEFLRLYGNHRQMIQVHPNSSEDELVIDYYGIPVPDDDYDPYDDPYNHDY